jgi:hypothetical protein
MRLQAEQQAKAIEFLENHIADIRKAFDVAYEARELDMARREIIKKALNDALQVAQVELMEIQNLVMGDASLFD